VFAPAVGRVIVDEPRSRKRRRGRRSAAMGIYPSRRMSRWANDGSYPPAWGSGRLCGPEIPRDHSGMQAQRS
jgi:hypothetical protein